jgi:two-component system sensor histidine kinase BarA
VKANSGTLALSLITQHKYDLILMDIQMPEMNGIETAAHIRNSSGFNQNVPIIAVSAMSPDHTDIELDNAGFNGFITKPINMNEIIRLLEKLTDFQARGKVIMDQSSLDSTPPIDMNLGKKLAGDKEDLALELIEMLLKDLPENKQQIIQLYAKQSFDDLTDLIHKLHGAACYCGVPRLRSAAKNFEYAIKNKQVEQYDLLYQIILIEIDAVISHGQQLLKTKI